MKKYCKLFILAAALMGGLSLNSCIDLDPIDYSDINPSNFPQTETDVESMVNSCYYSVRSSWFDGLFSTSERGVTVVNDLTTEILTCKSGFLKDVSDLNFFPTTADLTRFQQHSLHQPALRIHPHQPRNPLHRYRCIQRRLAQ